MRIIVLRLLFATVDFHAPASNGEPRYPLGGLLLEFKSEIVVTIEDVVKHLGKSIKTTENYLKYRFKNKKSGGDISYFFSGAENRVVSVEIDWEYRK